MWALAHPIRFRIWELLREGPSTASRLARRLGESRGSTSYHLRILGEAGAIEEDPALGTRRERWWHRPEERIVAPTDPDVEGRAIDERQLAMFFARYEDVRRRFVIERVDDDWQVGSFVGNWFLTLSPQEAGELGRRLFAIVDDERRTPSRRSDSARVLVSISVLPVLPD
jgi:DNA-binding transcriptional ArsR family regulator